MTRTPLATAAPRPTSRPERRHARRQGPRRWPWVVALVPLVVVGLALAAWALDTRSSKGEVLRGTEVAGRSVGGLDRAGLAPVMAEVATDYGPASVRLTTPDGPLEATGADLGLVVDEEATLEAALAAGRDGSPLSRAVGWLRSFVTPRRSDVAVQTDPVLVAGVVAERDPTGPIAAIEPSVQVVGGQLTAVPGSTGEGIDPAAVAAAIVAAASNGELPIVAEARTTTLAPQVPQAEAERVVAEARALTDAPLAVAAGETPATVPPEMLRSWVTSTPNGTTLDLGINAEKVLADLDTLVPAAPPQNAGFSLEGGRPVVLAGRNGTKCCDAAAPLLVFDALDQGRVAPVALPLQVVEPERTTAEAEGLGIIEEIGSFTTSHAAGESRVTNIHRIADLVRGVVIEPGGTFSVNDHVGRRTTANGFVEGGVIQNGVFETSVGGGISQFATTTFNAAFFGGLDFAEYQAHSIYISRYPYGREATLSFPAPDLVLENTTPHGVLLWPTYDASSITMTLYSTRFATGEQTAQSESARGACTRVTTERTRTYVDGRQEVDEVYATYRPGEGVDC